MAASAPKADPKKDAKPAAAAATAPAAAAASGAAAAAAPTAGLDDDGGADNEPIGLVSKEGKVFRVSKRAAMISTLVKTAIENDRDAQEVSLVHIESATVERIVSYMQYHEKVAPRKIEKPLKSTQLRDLVDEFDAKFADSTDQETMFKLLLAANYMDIKSLLLLMCAKCASLMKGKTPDQIRKTFNIRNDYTPEEEEEVRKEHKDLIE